MKKVVLTINDAVCLQNGKDVNATELLKVMRTYGTVEDFDSAVAQMKAEYQKTLDDVVAQNEAIKQQNLSEEEIAMVNAYRTQRAKAVKVYIDENAKLNKTLEDVKTEHERTIQLISNVINKK
jgi:uncharacterized protein YeeX (DUF496 family)